MRNSKRDQEINTALSSLRSDEPGIEIKSFAIAGKGLARVVVDVTHTQKSRESHDVVAAAIAKKVGGKMTAVANSFKSIDKGNYTERVTGLLGVVHDIIAVEDTSSMKGFRAMASNMFMDEEKDMWVLRKTEAGQVLVKSNGIEDDMSLINLLEGVASAGFRSAPEYRALASMSSGAALNVAGGDYVSYVDLNNSVKQGFIVATAGEEDALLLQPGAEDAEEIKVGAIVEKIDQEGFPEAKFSDEEKVQQAISASRGVVDPNVLVEYYRKVFSSNPAFFAEFEKRIRSHAWM